MQTASAQLNTYRQAPRKVRLLADLVRGKRVDVALATLRFANKRATGPIIKLLESAIANAKNMGLNTETLVVSTIAVNGGNILYRRLPMSRGRAFTKRKRTSHITVSVSAPVANGEKAAEVKAEVAPKTKKAVKASKAKK
jgi:large subunit ribosomal protein L22